MNSSCVEKGLSDERLASLLVLGKVNTPKSKGAWTAKQFLWWKLEGKGVKNQLCLEESQSTTLSNTSKYVHSLSLILDCTHWGISTTIGSLTSNLEFFTQLFLDLSKGLWTFFLKEIKPRDSKNIPMHPGDRSVSSSLLSGKA